MNLVDNGLVNAGVSPVTQIVGGEENIELFASYVKETKMKRHELLVIPYETQFSNFHSKVTKTKFKIYTTSGPCWAVENELITKRVYCYLMNNGWRAYQGPVSFGLNGSHGEATNEDDLNCFNCNQPGHIVKDCPEPRNQKLINKNRNAAKKARNAAPTPVVAPAPQNAPENPVEVREKAKIALNHLTMDDLPEWSFETPTSKAFTAGTNIVYTHVIRWICFYVVTSIFWYSMINIDYDYSATGWLPCPGYMGSRLKCEFNANFLVVHPVRFMTIATWILSLGTCPFNILNWTLTAFASYYFIDHQYRFWRFTAPRIWWFIGYKRDKHFDTVELVMWDVDNAEYVKEDGRHDSHRQGEIEHYNPLLCTVDHRRWVLDEYGSPKRICTSLVISFEMLCQLLASEKISWMADVKDNVARIQRAARSMSRVNYDRYQFVKDCEVGKYDYVIPRGGQDVLGNTVDVACLWMLTHRVEGRARMEALRDYLN